MNVSLSPEQQDFVQAQVSSGQYDSAADVVAEALRLLRDREIFASEIDRRIASLDRGEGVDGDEALARIRRKSADIPAFVIRRGI